MNILKLFFIAAALLTTLVWSITIPFNEAPDEYTHLDVPVFVAKNLRYPVFNKDENMGVSRYEIPGVVYYQNASYAAMPPLAYLWQSIFIKVWPVLQSYLPARLANVFLIVVYAFICWNISEKIFKKRELQLLLAALLVFIPQITFTFSYINSDAALLVLSSVIWWWITDLLTKNVKAGPVLLTKTETILLGITIGLAVLTRYNILPALLILGIMLTRLLYAKIISRKYFLTIGIIAFGVAGWWYIRNLILYHDFLANKMFYQTYYRLFSDGPSSASLSGLVHMIFNTDWLWKTWITLWGSWGWNTIAYPEQIYRLILIGILLSIFVVLVKWKALEVKQKQVLLATLVLFCLTLFLSVYHSWQIANQPQGRYLYSGWIFICFVIVMAVSRMKDSGWRTAAVTSILFLVASMQIYALLGIIIPHYY